MKKHGQNGEKDQDAKIAPQPQSKRQPRGTIAKRQEAQYHMKKRVATSRTLALS